MPEMDFGEMLKKLRKDRSMTLDEMAHRLGTTKQALSRYERGERTPKITVASKFAKELGVELSELIGYEPETIEPAEFLKNEQENYIPSTNEAKIISRGVDGLDSDDRQKALNVLKIMFQQHGDIFADHVKEYYETKDGPKDDLY